MKSYLLECVIGLFFAVIIVIASLASNIGSPFVYQGF